MALDLGLSYAQSNNAVTLTLTDSTGVYADPSNLGGWGAPNELVTNIVASTDTTTASKYHLLLDVIVTDKNGTETVYDQINLYDHAGGAFADTGDLVWEFNAADFIESSTAMGLSSARLDDGVYNISYTLVDNVAPNAQVDGIEQNVLIDGDVRADVYDKLRLVPNDYLNENNDKSSDIMEALLAYTYLQGTTASADTSQVEELYTQLYTLDKLVSDGSNYTW